MSDSIEVGTRVVDADDPDPDPAVVVNKPTKSADEWGVHGEQTVADFPGNEPYPDDSSIAVVVFETDVDKHGLENEVSNEPINLASLSRRHVPYYAFPLQRLEPIDGEGPSSNGESEVIELPPRLEAIADRLNDGGMAVEPDPEAEVLRASKLGESYVVHPDGGIEGDGALRDRLAGAVREVTEADG